MQQVWYNAPDNELLIVHEGDEVCRFLNFMTEIFTFFNYEMPVQYLGDL